MSWLTRRIRALFQRDALDKAVQDEIRLHIDLEAADLARSQGLPPNEARRRALAAFGGVDHYTEAHRDARGVRWLHETARDIRYAMRSLRRSPAFTLSAAAVLALGIGSSTAIFSAVDAVLVARLPYPNDEQLTYIFMEFSPTFLGGLSVVDYRAIEAQQRSFSSVGTVIPRDVAIATGDTPRRAQIAAATAGFFGALGVGVARGRALTPADELLGAPNVVIVGHKFATREFGNADAALQRSVLIDGVTHAVVGVLPPGRTELAGFRSEVWPALQLPVPQRRGPFTLRGIGRLKPGATLETARADLKGISTRLFDTWASRFQDRQAAPAPFAMRERLLRNASKTLWLFAGAVGLVLLIAVANVASLMLVRATARSREAALRTMLGASRTRLARLLVTESLVLSALGTVLGIVLAWGLLKALRIFGASIPRIGEATLDPRAVAFATLLTVLTGLLIGLYPVISVVKKQLRPSLGGGDREVGASRGAQVLRGALVTAQFALALPLLAGAGLMLNSFVRLQAVDAGFDPSRILYVHVTLPSATYGNDTLVATFWNRALARVQEVPGVASAGVGACMPPDDCWDMNNFDLVDRPVPPGTSQPMTPWSTANAGFFQALGVPLLDGRLFTEGDTAGGAQVILVSRAWAQRYSSDRPPLGRQLRDGGCEDCASTIIGIVGDVKYQGLDQNGEGIYRPAGQANLDDANLFVRTDGRAPSAVLEPVRAVLRSIDPSLALDDARSMQERLTGSVASRRHWTAMMGGFAFAALVLAAVGIFGMLSYLVTSRMREIGVRVALGARRSEVMSMIVRRGMLSAVPGAVVGLLVALLARRSLEGWLFDVSAADPLTLGAVTLLLLSVAVLACLLPARRAASADPMKALRTD